MARPNRVPVEDSQSGGKWLRKSDLDRQGIDRAGAQVLERRLRIGIGGYLRSRGLPLPELESASLTSPDDDAALGAIWDALAARGDPAGAGSSPGVLAY